MPYNYWCAFFNYRRILQGLNDVQFARIHRAAYAYAEDGIKPDFSDDPLLAGLWFVIEKDIDTGQKKRQTKVEAGRKGGYVKSYGFDPRDLTKSAKGLTDFATHTNTNTNTNTNTKTNTNKELAKAIDEKAPGGGAFECNPDAYERLANFLISVGRPPKMNEQEEAKKKEETNETGNQRT